MSVATGQDETSTETDQSNDESTDALETETATTETDYQAKYEAQQKVNRDLEAKFKTAANSARKKLESEYEHKLADALAAKDRPAEEVALETARREATEIATSAANVKLAKSALRLAAKGVMADPADALAFIDPTTFDVDDNGDVDPDALNEAITALLARKPHLAAGKQSAFQGGGDGGANRKAKPLETAAELAAASLASGDVRGSILHKMSGLRPIPPA